ncbi:phytanoyl-CoA dioxygenase domain-containing protein 1 homolog [Corticium candelabrum]|uniref:phytanoyl-CoA dioxygenase domain-containing protein 1 homolog n=1 Tax=Corticium candelabrum TaxID=121492 RepID=UPI002E26521D|nr:phytanoyl-CoA dioxygenase domain-containing protein 1 homolog [Corticium candelabrum]
MRNRWITAFSRRAFAAAFRPHRSTATMSDAKRSKVAEEFQGYTDSEGRYVNKQAAVGVVKDEIPDDVKDWSTNHKPSGLLFTPLKSAAEWSKFRLTQKQIDQYWQQGYLSNIPVLTEEQCDRILDDYKLFTNPEERHRGHGLFYEFHSNQSGDPNNVLMHALGHWRITQLFHDLVFVPAITVASSQLIDPSRKERDIRLWHDQLFAKPARYGGVVAWHQDYSYWIRTKPMLHLTVHVAVDEQTVENGGLHFVPGSHRWHRDGMPLPITDDSFADMESIQKVLTNEERAAFKPVPALLKKGEASFHHPLMVHGSFSNQTDKPRRAAVVNYIADGVYSDSDDPILAGTPLVKKGEKMGGQFYPLVYETRYCQEGSN